MTPNDPDFANRLQDIFADASEKPADERAAFLDRACGGDAALRAKVEALLAADEELSRHRFLDRPTWTPEPVNLAMSDPQPDSPRIEPAPSGEGVGSVINEYKLLQLIGEGGWGQVFMAEQTQPIRRKVALKLLKPGVDSPMVLSRFEAERQALAMMDHPNIARVLDAGQTASNRPYFVMELVYGVPITEYCDAHRMNVRQRLELFTHVCRAVQHAHYQGIIHRDIKPSNVMVADYDGKPVVKVIDFGIAKAIGQPLTEDTLFTPFGGVMGTLQYLSPEQATLNALNVDTRSDVYSLGVLLYELLTGSTPLTRERLRQTAFDAVLRIIREEDPPTPSTRLGHSRASLAAIAAARGEDPVRLGRLLRGELDWVLAKALDRDRAGRYQSPLALAVEIGHYLAGEPVDAARPTAFYKARKFVRRHRMPVLAGSLVVVALVAGLCVSLVAFAIANQEKVKQRTLAAKNGALADDNGKLAASNGALAKQKGALADDLRHTLSETDARIGHLLLDKGRDDEALAYEARALEEEPSNQSAVTDSMSLVFRYRSPLLVLRHDDVLSSAAFSPDGTRVVTASHDKTARVWDAATGKPVGERMRHGDWVSVAAFSPDGKRVVTASSDKTARVWDAATGKPVAEPMRHMGGVRSAAFSPDGTWVITVCLDNTVRVWDAATGEPVGEPIRNEGEIRSAAFSPDGKRVVTACRDNTARIWNAATGKPLGEPMRHEFYVDSATFSPDGRWVVTASWDTTARVWDAETGKPLGEPMRHTGQVRSATFSPDGRRVLTVTWDKTVRVWDAATGMPLGEPMRPESFVTSAAFSPDGMRVVITCVDNNARIWDAATGKPLGEPMRHENTVGSAAFSPDGTRVVTASWDHTARVWDAATTYPRAEPMRHVAIVWFASFSPDGTRVVAASGDPSRRLWEARAWDVATGKPLGSPMRHDGNVNSAAFSPDGTRVVTASSDKTAQVWDAATGKPLGSPMRHEGIVNSAAFSPDGARVVTASGDNTARQWDVSTGNPLGEPMRHGAEVSSAAFSPDGTRVITASQDKTARVWDAATGKPLREPMRHEGEVLSAAFSRDGTRVATASSDHTARVWDAATGKPLGEPMRHEGEVRSAVFSRDGTRVVTAGHDFTARVWDAATGKPLGEPMRHGNLLTSAAFSPDGTQVVTASQDDMARIWDAATGKPLGRPIQHESAVNFAAFSPDGMRVVTACNDSTARVWDVAVPAPAGSAFLAQLDQLAADRRFGPGGLAEPLPDWMALHDSLKRDAESGAAAQPSARWMTWFFADHLHRPLSPSSQITVAQWIANRLEENTPEGVREVWEADPNNARAVARVARSVIRDIPRQYWAGVPIYVELYSRRAVELAPKDAEVLWRRAAMLAWLGRATEAARAADLAPPPAADDLWAWEAKWEATALLNRETEAEAALATVGRDLDNGRSSFVRQSTVQYLKDFMSMPAGPFATQRAAVPNGAKLPDMKPLINSIGMKFVRIAPGQFTMGSPASEPGHQTNETQHKVTLTRGFMMAVTPVTQAQWKAVMGTTVAEQRDKRNPRWGLAGEGDAYPMYYVSWDEAVEFCKKLSQAEGKHYRLPTEAEWEYACRAGTQGAYGGTGRLDEMGWCADNSGDMPIDSAAIWKTDEANYFPRVGGENHCRSHPVGEKKANAWGLYDMHGNVWQWCSDAYAPYDGDTIDPKGGSDPAARIQRGGSWIYYPERCRSACRFGAAHDTRIGDAGFRLCLDPSD